MTHQSPSASPAGYQQLNPDRILETIEQLRRRINERFPQAGLASVCGELYEVARDARRTAEDIARPMWGLRIATYVVIALIGGMAILGFNYFEWEGDSSDIREVIPLMEAAFNDLILIGAAVLFLMTVEVRVKRKRALTAIHRLRSIAHIIDMHQLTKDPERMLHTDGINDTASSPKRSYTSFELGRYLDYCTEMLSLTGKVAAMYVESFPDAQAVGAVNELESLTTGLSRKIWQKIMVLNTDTGLTAQEVSSSTAADKISANTSQTAASDSNPTGATS
ncbi:hypothetical protein [Rubinisphaera brasiliensis]|uniref:Membrane associated protein n=1 Tax=Rubinisphaera brasiliensis (strain ATCC 49424 / DSM 5305 / JCM 21570 / IAM 15109 / NBRC 103401 / IFAM 1448) TaxID=756272 RepID=F0STG7_RUBBR|nr:hypothetical protein [Rubinisphaera brasiliensis]ADY60429.1 putative membrane associated protein [Rubinisphaera brasiliensis DSM 5305]